MRWPAPHLRFAPHKQPLYDNRPELSRKRAQTQREYTAALVSLLALSFSRPAKSPLATRFFWLRDETKRLLALQIGWRLSAKFARLSEPAVFG